MVSQSLLEARKLIESDSRYKNLPDNEVPNSIARKISDTIMEKYFVTKNVIKSIETKSLLNPDATFDNLYSLLYREDFIFQALIKIKENKGISTYGVDKKTLDHFSNNEIFNISEKIKKGTYTFKPVRKILIPKPGKPEPRPLGIPTIEDRIIQEMIRCVLEAIYEPIFRTRHKNVNYGFRSRFSVGDAILHLQKTAQFTEWAIEGDIKGAFNNVDHDILINILQEKIKDKKFLDFIKLGLKAGSIHEGHYEHTMLGTPQGGIASPILFNIYMSKLDEYINEQINEYIENINITEHRVDKPTTNTAKKLDSTMVSTKRVRKRMATKNKNLGFTAFKQWSLEDQDRYKSLTVKINNAKKMKLKVPYRDKKKANIRIVYVRYADDWVLLTNAKRSRVDEIKKLISDFLINNLRLTLSEDKTKITNLNKEPMYFLGHKLGYYSKNRKIKYVKTTVFRKISQGIEKVQTLVAQRTTGIQLVIGIDEKRVESRLYQKGFINKSAIRGVRKKPWTLLTDFEIVNRYNYMIRGLTSFYAPQIRDFSLLNKYIYLLNYSCYHTFANKYRSSIRKIMKKYGKPIKITVDSKDKKGKERNKTYTLLDYLGMKKSYIDGLGRSFNESRGEHSKDIDFFQPRINWRTVYKLNRYCVICGSDQNIQIHHVRHVRKGQESMTGFQKVMSNLNRKQIMVCKVCHNKIHRGTYDQYKLSDLYDPNLAIL